MSDFAIVIPSRRRTELAARAFDLFGGDDTGLARVVVDEREFADYAQVIPKDRIVCHPGLSGIGPIRGWIASTFDEHVLLMADDDVSHLWYNAELYGRRIEGIDNILRVIENAANVTCDLGLHVFGFCQAWDTRKFNPTKPFAVSTWAGGGIGLVGRDPRVRFSANRLRWDIDYCLQSLLVHRIVWVDNRYSFVHQRFGLAGGNSANRSKAKDEAEIEYLLRRWGRYLRITYTDTAIRLRVIVPRGCRIALAEVGKGRRARRRRSQT
ncbi:MAG: hypothetical protein H8E35_10125 [Ardenticatenia bacterium]|nr:hypothetical protein [Ardenticatenia bacterium]